jgi:hypothetical protein
VYINTLTVTAMIVVPAALMLFIARCVVHTCSASCEDKALCGDDVHEGERSWPL